LPLLKLQPSYFVDLQIVCAGYDDADSVIWLLIPVRQPLHSMQRLINLTPLLFVSFNQYHCLCGVEISITEICM